MVKSRESGSSSNPPIQKKITGVKKSKYVVGAGRQPRMFRSTMLLLPNIILNDIKDPSDFLGLRDFP
jgi:hypothetical protein